MNDISELTKRIQTLEDLEDIKRLKAVYALACDDKYNPEKMEPLFTEDAVWDGGKYFGRYEGRDNICNFFAGVSDNIIYALHYILMPHVVTHGDTADATWYLWMIATMKETGGVFGAGVYADKYHKINGTWLFKEVKLDLQTFTKYEDGWHKKPFSGVE